MRYLLIVVPDAGINFSFTGVESARPSEIPITRGRAPLSDGDERESPGKTFSPGRSSLRQRTVASRRDDDDDGARVPRPERPFGTVAFARGDGK